MFFIEELKCPPDITGQHNVTPHQMDITEHPSEITQYLVYILHCCYNKVFHARFDACNYVSTVHLQYITAIAIWTLKVDHATQLCYASSIPYIFIVDVLATYMVMHCKLSSFDYYHAVSVTCSYTGEGI